jgi:hypothetical protein
MQTVWLKLRWAAGSGQQAVGSRQWAVGSGQQAVGSRQWAAGSGQQAVGSRQWAAGSGQRAVSKRQVIAIFAPSGRMTLEPETYCCLRCNFSQILPRIGREQTLKKPSFSQKLGFSGATSICVAKRQSQEVWFVSEPVPDGIG